MRSKLTVMSRRAERRLSPLYRRLLQRCGALGLAGGLMFPALNARAQSLFDSPADPEIVFGGGLYVSFHFGQRNGVGFGVEGYSTVLLAGNNNAFSCSGDSRAGIGPLLQFGLVNLAEPRLVLAMAGGGDLARDAGVSLSGEIGAVYRFGERSGLGLHLGLTPQLKFLSAFGRLGLGLQEYSAGVGLRNATLFGPIQTQCIVIGRPLRNDTGRVELTPIAAANAPAQAWAQDAQAEHASVFAFADLGRQLIAAGAPPALIERAITAGKDEMRHATGCKKIADRYNGEQLILTSPEYSPRNVLAGKEALIRLATESWLDGCLGEGAAATWASESATDAADQEAQQLQATIAIEEAAHSALAWDILKWALRAGSDEIRHEVWKLKDREPQIASEEEAESRLSIEAKSAALEKHVADARKRLQDVFHSPA